jgi:DNA-binding beta-propeller fold protein YncE
MLKFHAALIDPSPGEISDALTAAVAGANARCRSRKLDDKPAEWRKFAREVEASPEGWRMWRGGRGGVPASQVIGAWWTDHGGRKHVVARGRRVEDHAARPLLDPAELGERCPLWHAYPEYVYRRVTGENTEWVCACGCGAVGTPAALGWMGRTCGPCFDREQEFGRDALRHNRPGALRGERWQLGELAVSPDGRWVAAREGNGMEVGLDVWDTTTGARRDNRGDAQYGLNDVTFTQDGTLLTLYANRLARYDPARDTLHPSDAMSIGGYRMATFRDADLVALTRPNWPAWTIELARLSTTQTLRSSPLPGEVAGSVVVSPDDRLVVVRGNERSLVLAADTFGVVADLPGRFVDFAFSPDGGRAFTCDLRDVIALDTRTWGRVAARPYSRPPVPGTVTRYAHVPSRFTVSPDGKHVFVGDTGGRVSVFDAVTLAPLAAFDWHIGFVNAVVVSADGEWLYTSAVDGVVKVWPIRQLLATG